MASSQVWVGGGEGEGEEIQPLPASALILWGDCPGWGADDRT